ncbi:Ribosomal silencing factor RsfS [Botrimarina colliarenosi]|uniref:Ribosomal silencing factor RsfS n=1 Tax=Botrimarina colliarenosi TaxID=2528001 RepID=A0A5C6AJT7_9BACT|nr:ribosome silencing factor [Botrimarina colliarenosi]TWT99291.1 Ribosomal silencing factor RsfS [Botrimarina colliarenosi]
MPASALEPAIADKIETATETAAPRRGEATGLELALAAAQVAADNRGENITILDLRELTPVFDYFVLATGNNRRQLHAISEEIDHRLEDDLGESRMGIEGYAESRWILLDYGSIVVHLFDEETRAFYAIEDLWTDAVKVPLPWDTSGEAS